MKDIRFTSPGLLLILGIVLSAGIFLLDLFYLKPFVLSHRTAALKEQASHVEQEFKLAVQTLEDRLGMRCSAYARIITASGRNGGLATGQANLPLDADQIAWICDADGNVLESWSGGPSASLWKGCPESMIKDLRKSPAQPPEGLMRLDNSPVLFAQQELHDTSNRPTGKWMGIACRYESSSAANLVVDKAPVAFIPEQTLPTLADGSGNTLWQLTADEQNLLVVWSALDARGNAVGYFQSQVPVTQVHRQFVAARRMVLIILSLSVGLVLLIIVGIHMLVAGPVLRLLRRLQQIESGKAAHEDLTHNLHGEPLVLARRLEDVFERLSHLSKTDQLTGIANRRHFEQVLDCFYYQARRYNRPLSLVVIDVDHFKSVNDTSGHQAGDELLKIIGQEIESSCRKADLPARWGGDEFAILMPETPAQDAMLVADRLRASVLAKKLAAGDSCVTLSIGIADLNSGEIQSPDAMVSLADRALYKAKEGGRNCVVQAHDLNGLTWPASAENGQTVHHLQERVAGLESQVRDFFMQAVDEMVCLLRERDPYMADHAHRVRDCAGAIAQELGLPPRVQQRLEMAAMLHDIGMIAMPDSILLAPGPLNEQQMQVMRRHPLLSVRIMERVDFLEQEIPSVRYHHERFDGKGYPEGLKGQEIPLSARILTVSDAYVAMTSPRSYRAAKSSAEAVDEVKQAAGAQFDPAVAEALLSALRKHPQGFVPADAATAQTAG